MLRRELLPHTNEEHNAVLNINLRKLCPLASTACWNESAGTEQGLKELKAPEHVAGPNSA